MSKIKLFVAAGLFIALTAVKMISPQLALEIKENTLRVIDRNDNYVEAIKYIDSLRLAEETPLPATSPMPEPEYLPAQSANDSTYHIKPLSETTRDRLPTVFSHLPKKEKVAETPPSLPESVTTFLQSQEAFADYDMPEGASYDYITLNIDYCSPVSGMNSSGFGYRVHPIYGEVRFHYGTDFAANSGTDILAFAEGTVIAAGYDSGYGNYIKLDHGNGLVTLYAHCSKLLVSCGEEVTKGERIAYVGATGLVTGPHLHFELMKDGKNINPEYYLGSV